MSEYLGLGINGYTAAGKAVLFASFDDAGVQVTAINDTSHSKEYIAYSIQRECHNEAVRRHVEVVADGLLIAGRQSIRITHHHDCNSIAWGDAGARYVVECTGVHTTKERCWGHLTGGAAAVVIAAQSRDTPTVVSSVTNLAGEATVPRVVCAGTGIGMALAPFLHLVDRCFGLAECSYTAIHSGRVVDTTVGRAGTKDEWRQTREAADAIVPYVQNGIQTIEKVMPDLAKNVCGRTLHGESMKGCAIDVYVKLKSPVAHSVFDETLRNAVSDAVNGFEKTIMYSPDDFISTDCAPDGKVVYDSPSTTCSQDGAAYKMMLWFNIEGSYARRVLTLVEDIHKELARGE